MFDLNTLRNLCQCLNIANMNAKKILSSYFVITIICSIGLNPVSVSLDLGNNQTFASGIILLASADSSDDSRDSSKKCDDVSHSVASPTAIALAGNKIALSWIIPESDDDYPIKGFEIDYSTNNGVTWMTTISNTASNTSSYIISELTTGTPYNFRIEAINQCGRSHTGTTSTATIAGDVPSTVSVPTVTVFAGGVMNMTWTTPTANGFPITSYKIEDSTNDDAIYTTFSTITGNPPLTHFLATGLTINASYQWRVEATNSLGTSIAGIASTSSIALSPLKIEAQTISGTLTQGASYSISPNPIGQNTSAIVVDGSTGDADGTRDGIVTVNMVPFGSYNIAMITIPSGFNVIGDSTIYAEGPTQLNGVTVFRLMPLNTSPSLQSTVITTQPSLNDTVLTMWTSTFHAIKINTTSTSISAVAQLPPILSAVSSNVNAIKQAISNQASVQIDTTFSSTTSPSDIIKTLGIPVYLVPILPDIVSVIPTIVTTNDVHNGQIVTTPPLSMIVPGQRMIIPVQNSVIPSTGGLKEIDVQSSNTASPIGSPKSDWFVIRTNNTMPSSLPLLPSTINKTTLFVNVTYAYEMTGNGFNWGNPTNFAHPPNMILTIPKPASGVPVDSNGCQISAIFVYDTNTKSWTSNPIAMLSTATTVGNSNTCDVVVQTQHFSQFAIGGIFPSASHSGSEKSPVHPFVGSSRFSYISTENNGEFGGRLLDSGKTAVTQTGKPIQLELNITAQSGSNYIQHVGFYINLNGQSRTTQDSDTYITYEPGQPLEISNAEGILSSVNVIAVPKGSNLDLTFNMTFAKPMKASDVIIRSWDQRKSSFDNVMPNALEIIGQPINMVGNSTTYAQETPSNKTAGQSIQSLQSLNIPDWFKSRTNSWSKEKIPDSDFTYGLQYLVEKGTIKIPENEIEASSSYPIPSWIKNNAKWWTEDQISDSEFVNEIQYLVENRIIGVK